MKTKGLILLLFGAVVLHGADYRLKEVKVLPIELYPAKTTVGSVTIAADPYPNDEKSFSAFDIKNLNSRGYYPVHVILHNGSSDYLTIHTRNILLITSSGQQLYTTPATILVEDLTGMGLTANASKYKSGSKGNSGSPLIDFSEKELTNRLLEPGSTVSGFLFFFTPTPGKNFFEGSTLYIPKLEHEGTLKPLGPFAIPLNPALSSTDQRRSR